jgi:hypothetical protein
MSSPVPSFQDVVKSGHSVRMFLPSPIPQGHPRRQSGRGTARSLQLQHAALERPESPYRLWEHAWRTERNAYRGNEVRELISRLQLRPEGLPRSLPDTRVGSGTGLLPSAVRCTRRCVEAGRKLSNATSISSERLTRPSCSFPQGSPHFILLDASK